MKTISKLLVPTEYEEQKMLCRWMDAQYPQILYRSDLGGTRLPIGLAKKMKMIQKSRAWPDFFVAKVAIFPERTYGGLYVELKRRGERLTKLNGEWRDDHTKEQAAVLAALRDGGYATAFACGFEEAQQIIKNYLSHV